jgi:hypothetical protein
MSNAEDRPGRPEQFGAGTRQGRRLIKGWSDEVPDLRVLLWLRLLSEEESPDTDVRSLARRVPLAKRKFIELRVCARIEWYAKTINVLNHARDVVSGAVAAGGAVIAGLTAVHPKSSGGLSWENYVVIALGVLVAVLGAVGPRVLRAQQVERYRIDRRDQTGSAA